MTPFEFLLGATITVLMLALPFLGLFLIVRQANEVRVREVIPMNKYNLDTEEGEL